MLQLLNLFQEMDFEIHYATTAVKTEFSVNIPFVSFHNIVLNDSSFDNFVANLNPAVVVFDRFIGDKWFHVFEYIDFFKKGNRKFAKIEITIILV